MPTTLSHVTQEGEVRMVDVSNKASTVREALAAGTVVLGTEAFKALKNQGLKKGDALVTARLAGIMAAKRTAQLIPLCHQISLTSVKVAFTLDERTNSVGIEARARATGPTGVEMEALTAVTVAALTLYDMCKAVSKAIRIEGVHLVFKRGGKSGAGSYILD